MSDSMIDTQIEAMIDAAECLPAYVGRWRLCERTFRDARAHGREIRAANEEDLNGVPLHRRGEAGEVLVVEAENRVGVCRARFESDDAEIVVTREFLEAAAEPMRCGG